MRFSFRNTSGDGRPSFSSNHAKAGNGSEGPLIEVVGLTKDFGADRVLTDVSFSVKAGEVVSLIGPSGVGKSTILRCINLLELPTQGQISLQGQLLFDNGSQASRKQTMEMRRELGMVFQRFNLFPHLTAVENVALGVKLGSDIGEEEAIVWSLKMLETVGLAHKSLAFPDRLSGGEQQRVAIARALALRPIALLFDEPTSSLDPESTAEVLAVMRDLSRQGMTMIVVTHELAFARDVSDRVLFIDQGGICEQGTADEVLGSPQNERTRAFLRGFQNNPISENAPLKLVDQRQQPDVLDGY